MDECSSRISALHRDTMAFIAREGLAEWLSDLSHSIGHRFHILPDGRAFYRMRFEWVADEPEQPGVIPWRGTRVGWVMSEPGQLAEDMALFYVIWKSRVDSSGFGDGAIISPEQRRLLRLAAGDALIDHCEQTPEDVTIWDRWTDGY